MATTNEAVEVNFPSLPADHDHFLEYVAANRTTPISKLVEPYKQYDSEMRKVFAQLPEHPAVAKPSVVPIFTGHEAAVNIKARNLEAESGQEKESYIMPLADEDRRADGSPAIVQSMKDFRTNFNVFSESALVDMDWSNVVVAGSAVVTSLLAVPEKHSGSKRALREYYHEQLAPASDVDLFLYGLSEEQAAAKIKQIEQNIRDAILVETTTIRTKNAITIASQYPTRHIQIVLRIYKSVSEILTGFDVDCSCAAYDGKQVYASPRALAAYMTQVNTIDLTRRSPSYENRLSKYAHRGFEVYWPNLDRSRIDPTIFERSFGRTEGLARLLILEKLPKSRDRDAYLDQRRAERGRPAVNRWRMNRRMIYGNIKNDHEDEVAEWVDADDVSDYHTFTIPYGPKFHARKIEKLFYTKDLLLNAEWNKPKDREVNLHRHPAFFGRADDVFYDCCGSCPKPVTPEEEEVAEEESKVYISGNITFIKDDPGRQTIGSFNPLDADGWTEMAYVGNTELLCKAIVDNDTEYVRSWLEQDGNDPNTRDYTGRTPLQLAAANSGLEIVQLLIDHGARLVARLVDGKTALHLAAMRGSVEIVSALLRKSEANEAEEAEKVDARRAARKAAQDTSLDTAMQGTKLSETKGSSDSDEDSDVDMLDDAEEDDDDLDATTEHSMINVRPPQPDADDKAIQSDEDDEPDVYDVNVVAWDTAVSPLHLAIVNGHIKVVETLVQEFGADVLLPIKLFNDYDKSARAAILTLVLAIQLPLEKAQEMARTLIKLGASVAQADLNQITAFNYCVADQPEMLDTLIDADKTGTGRAINHLSLKGHYWYRPNVSSALMTAIAAKDSLTALRLLRKGAKAQVDFEAYAKALESKEQLPKDSKQNKQAFDKFVEQPVIVAVKHELPDLARTLVEAHGVDANTLSTSGWIVVHDEYARRYNEGSSLLDEVHSKLKELRDWKPKTDHPEPPTPLKDDSFYMNGLQEGSYSWWSAQKQLSAEKERYQRDLESFEKKLKSSKTEIGLPEKQAAIAQMVDRYEQLESSLLEQDAKTFKELYPDIEKPDQRHHNYGSYTPPKPKPFEIEFRFGIGNLTDEVQARYVDLFEAAWQADLPAVKKLTLVSWKDSQGEERPPLTVSVQDEHGLNPFCIAVMQNQYELATAVMEIARAQYAPPEGPKQQRFGIDGGNSDDEGGDDVQIYSEIVDDQFTVESIGEVSTQVKSRTKPVSMLRSRYPVADFLGGPLRSSPSNSSGFSYFGPRRQHNMAGKRTNTGSLKAPSNHLSDEKRKDIGEPTSLIQFALHSDDQDLLIYLLSLGQDMIDADIARDDDDAVRYFTVSDDDYLKAIRLDRPHLLAELMKRAGAGLPLNKLVEKSGVEIKKKPKYYQGLSVYGKKRQDWADAGRGYMSGPIIENHRPGLLEAAHSQSIETVEWFLTDAPMRCYKEFGNTYQKDKRIKSLSEAKGGFEASVTKFLNARSHLAIHCCLMGKPYAESMPLLRHLIKAMPNAVNAKSSEGITPLQIAFWHYREPRAKLLIEAGADQTARDKQGNNLVHSLLRRPVSTKKKLASLPRMLDLIDKRVVQSLFSERTASHPGSLTPLAQWAQNLATNGAYRKHGVEVLDLIVDYSNGLELDTINGEGNTPLHVAVRESSSDLVEALLRHDPSLLLRENATGRTPFEMAEDSAIRAFCANPPPLSEQNSYGRISRRSGRVHTSDSNLVDRTTESFATKEMKNSKNDEERIYDLLKEVNSQLSQAKRKLVSLNEANEVARRLVANKSSKRSKNQGQGEDENEEDAMDGADEVQQWMSSARSCLEDDKEDGSAAIFNRSPRRGRAGR